MNAQKGKAPAPSTAPGAYGEQLSLLPPPPFCPAVSTRGTLADSALGMLMGGHLINHPDFDNVMQSWLPSPSEACPDRVFAPYRLDGKYTAQALAMQGGAQ